MTPHVKVEIERLIVNWGYWKSGGGGLAGGIMLGVGSGDSWREPCMPLLFGDARFTDKALQQLLEPQVIVLQAHYLTNLRRGGIQTGDESARDGQDVWTERIGDQARAKAAELGMSKATFYRLLAFSQKSFWAAFQLLKTPTPENSAETLDSVRQISILPATVV